MEEVFGFYDCSLNAPSNQPDMVTLWERSWRNRGWKPRLLTARHARRSKYFKRFADDPEMWPFLALHAVGGGRLTPFGVINFDLSPCPKGDFVYSRNALEEHFRGVYRVRVLKQCNAFGRIGWKDYPLVSFSNARDILNCGRTL